MFGITIHMVIVHQEGFTQLGLKVASNQDRTWGMALLPSSGFSMGGVIYEASFECAMVVVSCPFASADSKRIPVDMLYSSGGTTLSGSGYSGRC